MSSRTGEIRPLTFIVPSPRSDLISVKSLNHQGYRVIHDPDPEELESGIYPIFNGKIDKSKSFAFMSEHSNLFYIKAEAITSNGRMDLLKRQLIQLWDWLVL